MRTLAFLAVVGLTLAAVAGCTTSAQSIGSTSGADESTIDINQALQGNQGGMQMLCGFGSVQTTPACTSLFNPPDGADYSVKDVCALVMASSTPMKLDDATQLFLTSPTGMKLLKTQADQAMTQQAIDQDFTTAINLCINGQAIQINQQNQNLANDPTIQAAAAAAQEEYWHEAVRAVALTFNRSLNPVYQGSVFKNLRGLFLSSVCYAGADTVGTLMQSQAAAQASSGTCSYTWDSSRIGACVASGATICSALGGYIDLSSLGLQSDDDTIDWIEDAADVGLESVCQSAGAVGSIACGAINVAGQQIKMALETGDNDWAECLGISQAATCLGTWLGSDRWTNDSGVQTPRQEQGADGNPWTVVSCCECQLNYIDRQRGWIYDTDTITSSQNWTGVIQQGDFATGNCGVKEGAEYIDDPNPSYWDDVRHLHKYEGCQQIDVVGATCSMTPVNPDGTPVKTGLELWSESTEAPTGQVLFPDRTESTNACTGTTDGTYCGGDGVTGDPATVYVCAGGEVTNATACSDFCQSSPRGADGAGTDSCGSVCSGIADGTYCGANGVQADAGTLFTCAGGQLATSSACTAFCQAGTPPGQDSCSQ